MSQRTTKAARTAEAAVDRLEKLYAEATAGLSAALDRYPERRRAAVRGGARDVPLSAAARRPPRSGSARADPPARLRPPAAARRLRDDHHAPARLPPLSARAAQSAADANTAPRSRWRSATRRSPIRMCSSAPTRSPAAMSPPPSWRGISRRRSCRAVGDEIADGQWEQREGEPRPLSLFDAARVDYSLRRLVHYTGSDWRNVQQWILLTNYHRYVDQFIRWGRDQLAADGPFTRLVLPGGVAHRARRHAGAGRRASSPATSGIASRCRPITWSRRTAKA